MLLQLTTAATEEIERDALGGGGGGLERGVMAEIQKRW